LVYSTLLLFYDECLIAQNYVILLNQIGYYISFAVVIAPFSSVMDICIHNIQELMFGWKLYDYLAYQRYRFTVREHRWMMRNTVVDESIAEEFIIIDLLCFSSQYYYLVTMASFGMMMAVMGLEIYLRQNYVPFQDPTFVLFFVAAVIFGKFIEQVMYFLADIQIRRLNWRGLWATKLIEGTVDDEIAAKLAIGEGRQADLEQERLELQALNSERFRHRFLERNRPWILQHLVELLTPRSLDKPGPDGRPTIEYVRDVYAELMAMGEGMRRAGDRADISSDEEDELEAARRNWPRTPLTGAALAIARLWLGKARKRRAFSKLVRGIIDKNVKGFCEVCSRTPEKNNVKLSSYLATRGEPDQTAIDRLIGGFETQFGASELDPNLWKAYFRANAEFCTRCSICENAMEQEKLLQQSRAPGESRLTRPEDISSDEEDDDPEFEPLVVTRSSPEGRMMSKWLVAARRKLGGRFPRESAFKDTEKYSRKLKQLKTKKAKKAAKGEEDDAKAAQGDAGLVFSNATKALAMRWYQMAKDVIEVKFRAKSESLSKELQKILEQMPEEEDWYYGASTRMEGRDLVAKGEDLEADRATLEAEASIKINKIKTDLDGYVTERTLEIDRERRAFEAKWAQKRDRLKVDIDLRTAELTRIKELRKKDFMVEEKRTKEEFGAVATDVMQQNRDQLAAIDAQVRFFRRG